MINVGKVLDEAIEKDASDIHLIKGLKPILRIRRSLVEIPDLDALDEGDLYDIYDYIVRIIILYAKGLEYNNQQ